MARQAHEFVFVPSEAAVVPRMIYEKRRGHILASLKSALQLGGSRLWWRFQLIPTAIDFAADRDSHKYALPPTNGVLARVIQNGNCKSGFISSIFDLPDLSQASST
jgi:hypothetical protein